MYAGKNISVGDSIYVFSSENEGGQGLIAKGIVTVATALPRREGVERQTPRVNITVERTALTKRQFGRSELKPFGTWNDGQAETELNFKLYRQATNKVVGISAAAIEILEGCFR